MESSFSDRNRLAILQEQLLRLRGDLNLFPEASVVIPVNAKKDLALVLQVILDITAYRGKHRLEIILVINNYPDDSPPNEIKAYRTLGLRILAIPRIEYCGEIFLAARIPGIRAAQSRAVICFDADCRLIDPTALLDWYIGQFNSGVQLAYTHVGYHDLPPGFSIKVRMYLHHMSRWIKRVILGVPISRGSNYAVEPSFILDLYDRGHLKYDIKVGPTIKTFHGKIVYSGSKKHDVLTSGRNFSGGWKELIDYLIWRIGYYQHLKPLESDSIISVDKS